MGGTRRPGPAPVNQGAMRLKVLVSFEAAPVPTESSPSEINQRATSDYVDCQRINFDLKIDLYLENQALELVHSIISKTR
jgi:hypothetical protein